ncbi:MAG: dihydroorotate dehydrogenase [Armatimonadetes bacterium]|nr:dihydroorotate dehydrogenase [Armatimonadota bacterium]
METKTEAVNTTVRVGPIRMANPIMTASGTFGSGREYAQFFDLGALGAVVAKTVTLHPRPGNPPPRVCETQGGMLNSIGLQNEGIEHFLREEMPFLRTLPVPVLASIAGHALDEYVRLAERLAGTGLAGIELNLSCPNVEGGRLFCGDPDRAYQLVEKVRRSTTLPLVAKLGPESASIMEDVARACEAAGADALSLVNTFPAMSLDVRRRRSRLGTMTGGLSGPAIKPIAIRMVWEISRIVKIPIIGMGGIMTAEDALEFILAGATAIAVGTASFANPLAIPEIIEGIKSFLNEEGIQSLDELRGRLNI